MNGRDRPLVWLHGQIKTPPFSTVARIQAGFLLRMVQDGESLGMPWSRAMPSIGPSCHELRVGDRGREWRIIYRVDEDAIVIAHVFEKKTPSTPKQVKEICRRRYRDYDSA